MQPEVSSITVIYAKSQSSRLSEVAANGSELLYFGTTSTGRILSSLLRQAGFGWLSVGRRGDIPTLGWRRELGAADRRQRAGVLLAQNLRHTSCTHPVNLR